jgi:hypothetical protein
MGNVSTVKKLTAEQNLAVDSCIRRRRFVNINAIRADLSESGIEISRSALHCYMQKLKRLDGQNCGTPNDTVIVVMKRSTGSVINLTTSASMDMVIALIEGIPASN